MGLTGTILKARETEEEFETAHRSKIYRAAAKSIHRTSLKATAQAAVSFCSFSIGQFTTEVVESVVAAPATIVWEF